MLELSYRNFVTNKIEKVSFPNLTSVYKITDLPNNTIVAIIEDEGAIDDFVIIENDAIVEFKKYMNVHYSECEFFLTAGKHDDEYCNHVCDDNCKYVIPERVKFKILKINWIE